MHAVQVVGWGVDAADGPYWHVRNSWGSYWGEMGFVKIPRGNNYLSIEACDCWYAVPSWDRGNSVASGALELGSSTSKSLHIHTPPQLTMT